MSLLSSIPFEDTQTAEEADFEPVNSQDIANNMAAIFADQVKKRVLSFDKVPQALKPAVSELLNRGE